MSKVVDFFFSKRDNMLLFAASLAISVALFAQLQSGFTQDRQREIDVRLGVRNGEGLAILQMPRTARVLVTGSQQSLDSIDTGRIDAYIDLRGAKPGVSR